MDLNGVAKDPRAGKQQLLPLLMKTFGGGSTLVRWSKCFPGTVTDSTIGRRDTMETRVEPSEGRVYVSINTDVEKRYVRAE